MNPIGLQKIDEQRTTWPNVKALTPRPNTDTKCGAYVFRRALEQDARKSAINLSRSVVNDSGSTRSEISYVHKVIGFSPALAKHLPTGKSGIVRFASLAFGHEVAVLAFVKA